MKKEELIELLKKDYESSYIDKIIDGYSVNRYTTIRINTLKSDVLKIKEILKENNISYEEVEWYSNALIITNNSDLLTKLDIYNNGEIYLQSLSSMIPPLCFDYIDNESILDMTAAPGSKTTEICALTNNKCLITACEKNKIRCDRLKYNLNKLGARASVLEMDSRKLDDFMKFDKILLDAPCSGSGTVNINDLKISIDLINNSHKLQEELFRKALKLLSINSEMVYSTCSILKKENEDIIKKYLDKKIIEIMPIDINIDSKYLLPTNINNALTIMPNIYYEGFFVCKIKKISNF